MKISTYFWSWYNYKFFKFNKWLIKNLEIDFRNVEWNAQIEILKHLKKIDNLNIKILDECIEDLLHDITKGTIKNIKNYKFYNIYKK